MSARHALVTLLVLAAAMLPAFAMSYEYDAMMTIGTGYMLPCIPGFPSPEVTAVDKYTFKFGCLADTGIFLVTLSTNPLRAEALNITEPILVLPNGSAYYIIVNGNRVGGFATSLLSNGTTLVLTSYVQFPLRTAYPSVFVLVSIGPNAVRAYEVQRFPLFTTIQSAMSTVGNTVIIVYIATEFLSSDAPTVTVIANLTRKLEFTLNLTSLGIKTISLRDVHAVNETDVILLFNTDSGALIIDVDYAGKIKWGYLLPSFDAYRLTVTSPSTITVYGRGGYVALNISDGSAVYYAVPTTDEIVVTDVIDDMIVAYLAELNENGGVEKAYVGVIYDTSVVKAAPGDVVDLTGALRNIPVSVSSYSPTPTSVSLAPAQVQVIQLPVNVTPVSSPVHVKLVVSQPDLSRPVIDVNGTVFNADSTATMCTWYGCVATVANRLAAFAPTDISVEVGNGYAVLKLASKTNVSLAAPKGSVEKIVVDYGGGVVETVCSSVDECESLRDPDGVIVVDPVAVTVYFASSGEAGGAGGGGGGGAGVGGLGGEAYTPLAYLAVILAPASLAAIAASRRR